MKKGLILILCILPLVLFGQSYDRLSITHKLTGKNHVLKPGDRVILKGVNSNGKNFRQKGIILRFENNYIVLKDRYSQLSNDGQFISLQEINQINIVNQKKQTTLLLASIVVSLIISGLLFFLLYLLAYAGSISLSTSYILNLVIILILGFLSYFVVNSGLKKIKNLQTEWKIEQINLP